MGDLLQFPLHRVYRSQSADAHAPVFFFDVSSPLSYLAAERVERCLGEVDWVAVDGAALARPPRGAELQRIRIRAEARARALRLPLVWPEKFPARAPCALRAAAFACELGAGPAFALAASRLAFCGGFELDDPETLAEAAAAAAIPLGACLEAARESWRDEELRETARSLELAGVTELPAFRVAGQWLQGDDGLQMAAALAARSVALRRPLAPVG
jgi:2-hydroxychromene-2-carboxylate isomerase